MQRDKTLHQKVLDLCEFISQSPNSNKITNLVKKSQQLGLSVSPLYTKERYIYNIALASVNLMIEIESGFVMAAIFLKSICIQKQYWDIIHYLHQLKGQIKILFPNADDVIEKTQINNIRNCQDLNTIYKCYCTFNFAKKNPSRLDTLWEIRRYKCHSKEKQIIQKQTRVVSKANKPDDPYEFIINLDENQTPPNINLNDEGKNPSQNINKTTRDLISIDDQLIEIDEEVSKENEISFSFKSHLQQQNQQIINLEESNSSHQNFLQLENRQQDCVIQQKMTFFNLKKPNFYNQNSQINFYHFFNKNRITEKKLMIGSLQQAKQGNQININDQQHSNRQMQNTDHFQNIQLQQSNKQKTTAKPFQTISLQNFHIKNNMQHHNQSEDEVLCLQTTNFSSCKQNSTSMIINKWLKNIADKMDEQKEENAHKIDNKVCSKSFSSFNWNTWSEQNQLNFIDNNLPYQNFKDSQLQQGTPKQKKNIKRCQSCLQFYHPFCQTEQIFICCKCYMKECSLKYRVINQLFSGYISGNSYLTTINFQCPSVQSAIKQYSDSFIVQMRLYIFNIQKEGSNTWLDFNDDQIRGQFYKNQKEDLQLTQKFINKGFKQQRGANKKNNLSKMGFYLNCQPITVRGSMENNSLYTFKIPLRYLQQKNTLIIQNKFDKLTNPKNSSKSDNQQYIIMVGIYKVVPRSRRKQIINNSISKLSEQTIKLFYRSVIIRQIQQKKQTKYSLRLKTRSGASNLPLITPLRSFQCKHPQCFDYSQISTILCQSNKIARFNWRNRLKKKNIVQNDKFSKCRPLEKNKKIEKQKNKVYANVIIIEQQKQRKKKRKKKQICCPICNVSMKGLYIDSLILNYILKQRQNGRHQFKNVIEFIDKQLQLIISRKNKKILNNICFNKLVNQKQISQQIFEVRSNSSKDSPLYNRPTILFDDSQIEQDSDDKNYDIFKEKVYKLDNRVHLQQNKSLVQPYNLNFLKQNFLNSQQNSMKNAIRQQKKTGYVTTLISEDQFQCQSQKICYVCCSEESLQEINGLDFNRKDSINKMLKQLQMQKKSTQNQEIQILQIN